MSLDSHESIIDSLRKDQFLSAFETSNYGECFRLTDGVIGKFGESFEVMIANYHASFDDLRDSEKRSQHVLASNDLEGVLASLVITQDYQDDAGQKDYRLRYTLAGELTVGYHQIPVRLAVFSNPLSLDYWVFRDEKDAGDIND